MRVEEVGFYGGGGRLAGTMLLPDRMDGPVPGIVHGPGWLGLRDAALYRPYHNAFTEAGFGVLTVDYRGFGESEGDRASIDLAAQVADIRSGLSYLETRHEIDSTRLGCFGSGGTGGGNAVYVAGLDDRVKATISQVPIGDGREWLRRMRSERGWIDFLDGLQAERLHYVSTGKATMVNPRVEITVPMSERQATPVKADVDGRIQTEVSLLSAASLLDYRPIDMVARISPRALMIVGVDADAVTPEHQAIALYDAAGAPKRLVMQSATTHYGAYGQYANVMIPLMVDWFDRYLVSGPVQLTEDLATEGAPWTSRPISPTSTNA